MSNNSAIVGNIGHSDNELGMAGLEDFVGIKVQPIKPQVDQFEFHDRHEVSLSEVPALVCL